MPHYETYLSLYIVNYISIYTQQGIYKNISCLKSVKAFWQIITSIPKFIRYSLENIIVF